MKITVCPLALALVWMTSGVAVSCSAQARSVDENDALTRTVTELDAKLFDAYNHCDMDTFREFFIPGVEFYHDQGGVTFDRETVVENTRTNICHKIRRELLSGTLRIYPVKDFGAIEEGEHRFCQIETGKCEGIAKFLMIWQNKDGKWLLTRIVSYGHREMTPSEKASATAASR